MFEARVVLQDAVERNAFEQFMSAVDGYRQQKAAAKAAPRPETPPPANSDPAVVAHISEAGVKVTDRRAAAKPQNHPETEAYFSEPPEITYEMIFAALADFVKNHPDGLKAGRKLLDEFETVHVNKLPKEKYAEFYKRVTAPVVVA